MGAGTAHLQPRLLWTQSVGCAASAAQTTARRLWNCPLSLSFSSENNMAAVSRLRWTEKKDRRTSHSFPSGNTRKRGLINWEGQGPTTAGSLFAFRRVRTAQTSMPVALSRAL